jgi:protein TonB
MFEQSLLLDHAAGKKTGALAESLTVQTLAVGVMIAIPLLYSDRLPAIPRFISLSLPAPPPPPPTPVETTATTRSSRPSMSQAHVYRPPTRIIPLSEMATISMDEAPPVFSNANVGVPGGTGPATALMEQIFKPIPQAQPKPKIEAAAAQSGPIRVSSGVQEAKILKRVIPVYPPLAKQARVSGTVRLIGVIAKDGTMQQLQLVSGHPLLVDAALSAVRQWIYRPTLLSGQAVEVIAPIDVIFSLSQ